MRGPFTPLLLLFCLALPPALAAEDSVTVAAGNDSIAGMGDWGGLYRSIQDLPRDRQKKAEQIVSESLPVLEALDKKVGVKMDELRAVTYSDTSDCSTLPQLGMDLSKLRNEMRQTLMQVNMRLQQEAGVSLGEPAGRGLRSMRPVGCGGAAAKCGR